MRYFYRYLLITLSGFFLLGWILPQWLPIHYPRALGPTFSKFIRKDYQSLIDKQKPNVILLGNSVLINSMDESQFESLTGRKTLSFATPGAASAYWYLSIKNVIATASAPPKYVLLFFMDNILTTPDQWVIGAYFPLIIDEIAGEQETVLLQKAYLNQLNPLENYLDSHYPLFGERLTLKDKIDNRIKYTLSYLFQNCAKPCLDKALEAAFGYKNMIPLMQPQLESNSNEWSGREWDFNALVEKSFLPDMIQITKERGIKLILVREKNAKMMTLEDESSDMRKYFQELADYLKKEGIPLLDFAHDPNLTLDLFHDEMHLNPQARAVFTPLVADKFLTFIKEK